MPFLTVLLQGQLISVDLIHLLGYVGLPSKLSHGEVNGGFSSHVPQSIVQNQPFCYGQGGRLLVELTVICGPIEVRKPLVTSNNKVLVP